MAAYTGRRAPNVSQYLADLNTVPTNQAQNDFNIGDDGLDFLTNAEFFDFDSYPVDYPAATQAPPPPPQQQQADVDAKTAQQVGLNGGQFQFNEFPPFDPSVDNLPGQFAAQPTQLPAYPLTQQPGAAPTNVALGSKRDHSTAGLPSPGDLEDHSRAAAEEDKRRRNTAASARFRVKKKQREQALEKQTKEMSDKMSALEGKVQELERENRWLKGLIVDKDAIQAGHGEEASSGDKGRDGVGTVGKVTEV